MSSDAKFAIVTGASTGIGYELAKKCAGEKIDLLIGADEAAIHRAAGDFRGLGAKVESVQADLATLEGVEQLCSATKNRSVDYLFANAGRGLGHSESSPTLATACRGRSSE